MSAVTYNAVEWALTDATLKKADCVVVAGDITCDGNITTYNRFIKKLSKLPMPAIYIPGNSDLRDERFADAVKTIASPCKTTIGDVTFFALNDCDKTISKDQLDLLCQADENSIVFMHHPPKFSRSDVGLSEDAMLFYAHKHISLKDGNDVALQSIDPDKAKGEPPCITYYDTKTKQISKAYYFAPIPSIFMQNLGVSCYRAQNDIQFAMTNGLKYIELRPNILKQDKNEVKALVEKWRSVGGVGLSVHLPDVRFEDGAPAVNTDYFELLEFAKAIGADRLTQHVPKIKLETAKTNADCLDSIAKFISDAVNSVGFCGVLGIENMHTSQNDTATDRRYGCTPEECFEFMSLVANRCNCKVGFNFDIGHARNNMPLSRKYQISSWLAMLGKYTVGYHFHQVKNGQDGFENHRPINDLYEGLINYTSFFKCWLNASVNQAPVILEMRGDDSYDVTLKTLKEHFLSPFDIHSHTYYSSCGKDAPEKLVKKAIECGISTIGITDHAHGIGERLESYKWEIRDIANTYRDKIRVMCGVEIATLPSNFDITLCDKLEGFDYCIIEHITEPQSCVGKDLVNYCKRIPIPCGIAHTDLFKYCKMYGFDCLEYFKQLADIGVFWELNVSYDSIHKYNRHTYVYDFINDAQKIDIVKRSGIKLSIGFDSHRCDEYYAPAVYDIYRFLKQNNIDTFIK